MPFKIRLKKSRQYNVASKSLFVICVELLDSTSVECTLSAESSGRDCLDNVCQRLGLQQPEFFGLRYVSVHDPPRLRWVEMDRPLKRQLDKHAREPNLLLRVMYYVSGVNLLHDEMTRYHYFLQLKSDVIEGRMACDIKQAILLASYSMQAEFGNHDLERHTAEYLKDFALFPKHLTEEGHLEALTEAVICQHAALVGLPQGTAEEYYILAAQQLDGYGQETFNAKDEAGSEVIIGVSLSGIVIGYECNQSSKYYRWKDIANVVNHKRNFAIECPTPEETVQFQFSDPESAKYVWRMCVHQHTFYMQNENACEQGQGFHDQIADTLFKNISEEALLNESREELNSRDGAMSWENQPAVQKAQSTSCLDLTKHTDVEKLRSLLPSYRPAPDYETAMQLKYRSSGQSSSAASVRPSHQVGIMYSSHPEIHQTHIQENVSSYAHYKHFPDVTQVERLYLESHTEDSQRLLKGQSEHSSAVLHTYSTPDLDAGDGNVVQSMQLLQLYKPPPPYPSNRPNSNSTPDLASQTLRPSLTAPQVNSLANITKDTVVSGSSPDLVSTRNHHYVQQLVTGSETHQQYTNIAAMLDPGLVYCVVPPPEPIYENVPLPWAASARSRTSSIQSAPEMSSNTQNNTTAATSDNAKANHAAHELVSFSFPLSGKNRLSSQVSNPVTEATTSSAEVNLLKAEPCIDSPHQDSAKQKPKRKWGLLGGGKKSKSIGLTKEKSQEEIKHRWSTGLPRLPLPPTISKETMCQLLERKLLDSQLFFEFEKIPKKKPVADFSVALHPDNVVLNRYKDVLPYEENRVRLTPTKENKFGYINASHITASVGNHQRFYIAAQGPMSSTIMSFWQMVWEADVYLIVQLTGTQEDGAVQYCPGLCDRCLESDQFQVWRQFSQETGHCVTTKLRLFHTPSRSVRGVWHLQYLEWGDQGCPNNVGHFLGFLEELNSVRQHTVSEIPAAHNRNPPILVHCSAGVGRTGITILSDLLLYTLDHNQELDVPRVVAVLRNQRMLLVQTVAQYRFVYSLLIHYLKHSRLI